MEKEISKKLTVHFPLTGFRHTMLFNRFQVVEDGGYKVIFFAYVYGNSGALGCEACAINKDDLEAQRAGILDYSSRLGELGEPKSFGGFNLSPKHIYVANVIGLSYTQNSSETVFANFSVKGMLDDANKEVNAEPIFLLRSSKEVQNYLIASLYES